MNNFSVVIPSNRSKPEQIRKLLSTIDIFLKYDFEVVVSDNSGSIEKEDIILKTFSDKIKYIKVSSDVDAYSNFYNGFKYSTGKFVLFATDDDTYLEQGLNELVNSIDNSDGYITSTIRISNDNLSFSKINSNLVNVNDWSNEDISNVFYGCYSRRIWNEYFNLFKEHPYKFAHQDQMLRFILCFYNIKKLNMPWFIYDFTNWSNPENCTKSLIQFYKNNRLDERMLWIHPLLLGIEGLATYTHFNPYHEDRNLIVNNWLQIWYNNFLDILKNNTIPDEYIEVFNEIQEMFNEKLKSWKDIKTVIYLIDKFMKLNYQNVRLYDFWDTKI